MMWGFKKVTVKEVNEKIKEVNEKISISPYHEPIKSVAKEDAPSELFDLANQAVDTWIEHQKRHMEDYLQDGDYGFIGSSNLDQLLLNGAFSHNQLQKLYGKINAHKKQMNIELTRARLVTLLANGGTYSSDEDKGNELASLPRMSVGAASPIGVFSYGNMPNMPKKVKIRNTP